MDRRGRGLHSPRRGRDRASQARLARVATIRVTSFRVACDAAIPRAAEFLAGMLPRLAALLQLPCERGLALQLSIIRLRSLASFTLHCDGFTDASACTAPLTANGQRRPGFICLAWALTLKSSNTVQAAVVMFRSLVTIISFMLLRVVLKFFPRYAGICLLVYAIQNPFQAVLSLTIQVVGCRQCRYSRGSRRDTGQKSLKKALNKLQKAFFLISGRHGPD